MREMSFDVLKLMNKEVCADIHSKSTGQMSFGRFIENNLLAAFEEYKEGGYIEISKSSKADDYLFGADFKITFQNPEDKNVDGMSSYVDITLRKKPNVQWFGYREYDGRKIPYILKRNEEPMPLCYLRCGLKVHVGIKKWHSSHFQYKKPVMVIYLSADSMLTDFTFTEDDIRYLSNALRRTVFFTSYKMYGSFNGEELQGYGKRASKIIAIPEYSLKEATIGVAD